MIPARRPLRLAAAWRPRCSRVILCHVGNLVSFLIAEDDELVGRLLVRALSAHGKTELVTTVADARSAMERESFTAVVVDVGLPDGSGLDLINDARAQDPTVSALVVSGRVDARRLAAAHVLDASYLLKPVNAEQIELFAVRMRSKVRARAARIAQAVEQWSVEYELTRAEASILEIAAEGASRSQLAAARGVAPNTLKKQVQILLAKTGDSTLDVAVNRLLRTLLDEG